MKQFTIFDADASKVVAAIKAAKPLTSSGNIALENVAANLQSGAFTAHKVVQLNQQLANVQFDPGLENVKETLQNVSDAAHLNLAIAYESIANNDTKTIFGVGLEAANVLAELYKLNASKIIDAINGGALQTWHYNPVVARLISMAKSAARDRDLHGLQTKRVIKNEQFTFIADVPIINLASIDKSSDLVFIDGMTCIFGSRGKITPIRTSEIEDENVQKIISALDILKQTEEANVFALKEQYQEALTASGLGKLEIDILAPDGQVCRISGKTYSISAFLDLLSAGNDELLAQIATSGKILSSITIIKSSLKTLSSTRSNLLTGFYLQKLELPGVQNYLYVGKQRGYSIMRVMSGQPVFSKSYPDVYAMLGEEFLVEYPKVHTYLQDQFSQELVQERSTLNAKTKLLEDLAREKSEYIALRTAVLKDIEMLEDMPDVNTSKITALTDIKMKLDSNIETVENAINSI